MIVIRSCKSDGSSWGGFIWPLEVGAVVEAPDWDPNPECGNGLHGLRPGDNIPGEWYVGVYMALDVNADEVVDLDGKCKFPRATIIHVAPDMRTLSQWLSANGHPGPWYRGTAITGNWGTAITGDWGTATAGVRGVVAAGVGGVIILRDEEGAPHVGLIGQNGLKPGVRYRLNDSGEFEEVNK